MIKKIFVTLVVSHFWLTPAWPVSRVGTGTLSNDDIGFQTAKPAHFSSVRIFENGSVRMQARMFGHGRVREFFVLFMLLENEQPQWVGRTDRAEFRETFEENGWTRLNHKEPCVEAFKKDSDTAITYILSWGDGRGAIFTAPLEREADVMQMANDLTLFEGVCSWK